MLFSKIRYSVLSRAISVLLIHAFLLSNLARANPSTTDSLSQWLDPAANTAMKVALLRKGGRIHAALPGTLYEALLKNNNAEAFRAKTGSIVAAPDIAENEEALAKVISYFDTHENEQFYRIASGANAVDLRPIRAGLLSEPHVRYDQHVERIVNSRIGIKRAIYGGAGMDVSNFLLSTNAKEAYFVSHYQGLTAEDLRGLNELLAMPLEGIIRRRGQFPSAYLRRKHHFGFADREHLRALENNVYALVCELKAMEIHEITVFDNNGCPRIEFMWKSVNDGEAKERSITFIDADITDYASYSKALDEAIKMGFDLYYQRAAVSLPMSYKIDDNYISYLKQYMSEGGYFVTDDIAYLGGYVYSNVSHWFPDDGLETISHNTPELIQSVIGDVTAQAEPECYYGWFMNIRQKIREVEDIRSTALIDIFHDEVDAVEQTFKEERYFKVKVTPEVTVSPERYVFYGINERVISENETGHMSSRYVSGASEIIGGHCGVCTFMVIYDTETKETWYGHSKLDDPRNLEEYLIEILDILRARGKNIILYLSGGTHINTIRDHQYVQGEKTNACSSFERDNCRKRIIRLASENGIKVIQALPKFTDNGVKTTFDPDMGEFRVSQVVIELSGQKHQRLDEHLRDIRNMRDRGEVSAIIPRFEVYEGLLPTTLKESTSLKIDSVARAFGAVDGIIDDDEDRCPLKAPVSRLDAVCQRAIDPSPSRLRLCIPVDVLKNCSDIMKAFREGLDDKIRGVIPIELAVTGVTEDDMAAVNNFKRADIKRDLNLPVNLTVSMIEEADIQERARLIGVNGANPVIRAEIVKQLSLELNPLDDGEHMAIATDGVKKNKAEITQRKLTPVLEDRISIRVLVQPEAGKSMFSLSKILCDWLEKKVGSSIGIILPKLLSPKEMIKRLDDSIRVAWKVLTNA